jgi:hypothetical protein
MYVGRGEKDRSGSIAVPLRQRDEIITLEDERAKDCRAVVPVNLLNPDILVLNVAPLHRCNKIQTWNADRKGRK